MAAMQLFSKAAGGIGAMFGSSSPDVTSTAAGADYWGGLAGAADGGMITGPTLIGENGPEIFIPQRSGTVIPNQQLSSQMGGQAQTVINGPYIANMSAIDTQSAMQFISKNKMTIYSANQSAARSIPTNR